MVRFCNRIRKSCYECGRLQQSNADITLGDWWRVADADDVRDTDEGVSLVGVHSEKGLAAVEELISKNLCYSKQLTKEQYTYAYQPKCRKPVGREEKLHRILEMENLFQLPISLKKYLIGLIYETRARMSTNK